VADLDATSVHGFSIANDINDWHGIVGEVLGADGLRGFFWYGVMQKIAPLPGDTSSGAQVINNRWDICGHSTFTPPSTRRGLPPSTTRAVCWDEGQPIDLNTRIDAPGWTLVRVTALNDRGHLAVLGTFQGQRRLALLVPQGSRVAGR
jgi:hypothetical protein